MTCLSCNTIEGFVFSYLEQELLMRSIPFFFAKEIDELLIVSFKNRRPSYHTKKAQTLEKIKEIYHQAGGVCGHRTVRIYLRMSKSG